MTRKHDPQALPWERQPRETPEAWDAWVHYRDAGEARSLAKTADVKGKSVRTMEKHSRRWGWGERVRQYGNHLDRIDQADLLKKQKVARDRHASLANAHMSVLSPIVIELNRLKQADGTLPDTAHVKSLLRLAQMNATALKQLVEVERVSLGLHSMHAAVSGPDGGAVKVDLWSMLENVFETEDGET